MKILFIHPPHNSVELVPSNFEPLSLEILASTVHTHTVKIVDLRFETLSHFTKILNDFGPDVTGISVNNTIHVNPAKRILEHIKNVNDKIITVVGGHHPTLAPQDFYISFVNAIFIGWADKNFPKYIHHLESKNDNEILTGLILLKNGRPIYQNHQFTKLDAADIPKPNRALTSKYGKYYKNEIGQRFALINTARGCPYRCSFCACWHAANGHYLVRSALDVYQEIAEVPFDIPRIFFADDHTFHNASRAKELYDLIKSNGLAKKYSGYCRSDTIVKYPDLFRDWKEIGLGNLTVGFESIDNDKLKEYNKDNRVEINKRAVSILNDLNLRFTSYFLIDPFFNENDFNRILRYIHNLNLIRPRFVILTPLPGTYLYKKYESVINLSYDYFDFLHWVYPTKLKSSEFFNHFKNLYYEAYSFKRYFKILLYNIFIKIWRFKGEVTKLKNIALFELVLLRIMAIPIRHKLYKQYFLNNIL